MLLTERLRATPERAAEPVPPQRACTPAAVPARLSTPAAVLALQQSAGNHAVGRLLLRAERRCACGGIVGPEGECAECRAKRLSAGALARQPGDAPRAVPVLTPSDPRLHDVLEPVAETGARGPSRRGPSRRAPPSLPLLPRGRTNLPIKMDEGTRRSPKLKDPGAPGGAKCRGACGIDCPSTCKYVGTYRETYVIRGTGYLIEFPNAILCGTHEGCQWHDDCFDVAVGEGENPFTAPIHTYCNWIAAKKYKGKVKSWMAGGGPYQDWWYFVDNPFIVKTWPVGRGK